MSLWTRIGTSIVSGALNTFLEPFVRLGEKYLEVQTNRDTLRAGTEAKALEVTEKFRTSALETIAFRIPFFILFTSHAVYAATIVLDSYAAWNGFFAPLKLPDWYHENFQWVLLGLTGVGPFIVRRK